jgi:hypothetical protein
MMPLCSWWKSLLVSQRTSPQLRMWLYVWSWSVWKTSNITQCKARQSDGMLFKLYYAVFWSIIRNCLAILVGIVTDGSPSMIDCKNVMVSLQAYASCRSSELVYAASLHYLSTKLYLKSFGFKKNIMANIDSAVSFTGSCGTNYRFQGVSWQIRKWIRWYCAPLLNSLS